LDVFAPGAIVPGRSGSSFVIRHSANSRGSGLAIVLIIVPFISEAVIMALLALVFAYFSPETVLPLASVLASAVGVLLLFGRSALRLVRGLFRIATRRGRRVQVVPRPHFEFTSESVATAPPLPLGDLDSAPAGRAATDDSR
jgi:hypothetical protein